MPRLASSVRLWVLAAICCGVVMGTAIVSMRHLRHRSQALPTLPATFPGVMPRRVLWAWEEPEDLRTLPPSVGIAYLAETILVSDRLTILPRRQPLVPAAGAPVMAVVRIETRPGFSDRESKASALDSELAARLAAVAARPATRALQIDFDAASSQREFYSTLLTSLRARLPQGMPLSITALVSWCGPHSWLHTLPIDEAVPMFFRMGGPRARAGTKPRPGGLSEPLCRTSIGLATDEPWPRAVAALNPSARVYLFAPKPWQQRQLAAVAKAPIASLAQELQP